MLGTTSIQGNSYGDLCRRLGLTEDCGLGYNELQEKAGLPLLNPSSMSFLDGFAEDRKRVIVLEARRLKGSLSSNPWYAKKVERDGDVLWLRLAVSYWGDD